MKYTQQMARYGAAEHLLKRAGELALDNANHLAAECLKEAVAQADAYLDEWYATGEGYESEKRRMSVIASYRNRISKLDPEYSIEDAREAVRGNR